VVIRFRPNKSVAARRMSKPDGQGSMTRAAAGERRLVLTLSIAGVRNASIGRQVAGTIGGPRRSHPA
jgi:hypothetical protein